MATKRKGKDAGKKTGSPNPADPKNSKVEAPSGSLKSETAKLQGSKVGQSEQKKDGSQAKPDKENAGAKPKAKKSEEGEANNSLAHFLQFLKEVNVEARKITWPDRSLILRETWGVLILVAVLTFLVLGFDWAVGHFVFQPLEHWARLMGGGIGH
jgi:preprotein translocase SecE subunit